MRKYLIAILATVLSMVISIPVFADTAKDPVNVFQGDEITSKEVNTDGDVYSFGSSVILWGDAKGDIISMAGTIELKDLNVGGNIRTISGDLKVSAKNVRNITSIAQSITVDNATVARGVYLLGSSVNFFGTAEELYIGGENVIIDGTVNGDVTVECDTLTIGENAKIQGKLNVTAKNEPIINGTFNKENMSYVKMDNGTSTDARSILIGKLLSLASALLIGLVLVLICKNYLLKAHDRVKNRWWIPVVIGFTTLIVLPIAAILTMITVIGIPISMISLMVYGVLIYLAPVIAGIIVGPFILRNKDILLSAFVGVLLVKVLTFIPYIGVIVTFAAIFLSLGVFVLNIAETISNFKLKS